MKKEQRKTDIKKKMNIEINPIPKVALRTNGRTNERTLKLYILTSWPVPPSEGATLHLGKI